MRIKEKLKKFGFKDINSREKSSIIRIFAKLCVVALLIYLGISLLQSGLSYIYFQLSGSNYIVRTLDFFITYLYAWKEGLWGIISFLYLFHLINIEFKKADSKIEEVTKAVKDISSGRVKEVALSSDLKAIETHLNQIISRAEDNRIAALEIEQNKNNLIVYLAHDLKTPLTSVIGYVELLRQNKELPIETREKYITVALNKAERLEYLIDEFFSITRFNLTEIEIFHEEVNMTRFIEQKSSEYEVTMSEKNICCNLNLERDVLLNCDRNKMERVIDNLISNAVRYVNKSGELQITCKNNLEKVEITFQNSVDKVIKEDPNKLFEEYYRTDNSRNSENGGAGLGLAISKKIVELHQGTIEACSDKKLIEFKVSIPKDGGENNEEL